MIRSIQANQERFKPVRLEAGFNLVLAQQSTEESEDANPDPRRSTNGSGKTLLLLICHFCLGSDSVKQQICVPELEGWEFAVSIDIQGSNYEVRRSVDVPARVRVTGDLSDWVVKPVEIFDEQTAAFDVESWRAALGDRLYGLDPNDRSKGRPTFGSLFRYAIRRGEGAFLNLFKSFALQKIAERDVTNAVLLGIDWGAFRNAHQLTARRDRLKKANEGVTEVMESGELRGIGELEGQLAKVERTVERQAERLGDFQVHPRYREIEQEVTALTTAIRKRTGQSVSQREALAYYRQAVEEEDGFEIEEIRRLYADAEVEFPNRALRRLEEAEDFAKRLTRNRRDYLDAEIERLVEEIADLDREVERLDKERSTAVASIAGTGAVEDLLQIRSEHTELSERRGELRGQIEQLRGIEEQLAEVATELERNKLAAREDLDAGRQSWTRVAELFEEFTGTLFEKPGTLLIDVQKGGKLRLDRDIERKGSQGVSEMLVFCYDLALAVANAERNLGPRLLFHDSTVFDGVDPRQKAAAIRLAIQQAEAHGFQYLLCINEGDVPWSKLDDVDLRRFLRVQLSDEGDGGLLGIRY